MIIKNAEVVSEGGVKKADIRIEEGKIAEIAPHIEGDGVDCTGLTVFPGLIDMHTPKMPSILVETASARAGVREERGYFERQPRRRQGRVHAGLLYAQHQARHR